MATPYKKLENKTWLQLRDLWLGHIPDVRPNEVYPEPTLWQLPDISKQLQEAKHLEIIPYSSGVREAIFREAILLIRKFSYCWSMMDDAASSGRPSWSSISAYESCFYAAKAFCYLLGVASVSRSSNLYVDVFYLVETGTKKNRKTNWDLRIYEMPDRLTHTVLWSLVARLIETTKFEGPMAIQAARLQDLDWKEFSHFRNQMLYVGNYWPQSAQYELCDLVKRVSNRAIKKSYSLNSDNVAPFASEYFAAAVLFRKMLTHMVQSIAELAPAMEGEVALLSSDEA